MLYHLTDFRVWCRFCLHLQLLPWIPCQSNSFCSALSRLHLSVKKCIWSLFPAVGVSVDGGRLFFFFHSATRLTLNTCAPQDKLLGNIKHTTSSTPRGFSLWKDLPAWHQVFMAVNYKALINWQQIKKYSVSHTENGKRDGGLKQRCCRIITWKFLF